MGLRDQNEYKAAAFEPMEAETETTTATKDETMTTQTTTQDAGVAATTAIAKAATTAVGAAKKFVVAFADKKDAMDIDMVSQFQRVAPAVTAEQGSLKLSNGGGTKEKLGKAIRIRIVSFNNRWLVATGENDQESKGKIRNSYDKVNLDGEDMTVDEYVAELRAEGYKKTKVEPYIDLWADIVWTEAKGDIPAAEQQLTRLQLSKTSSGNFSYFCGNRGRQESAGLVEPLEIVEVHCEDLDGKSGSYSNMSFHAPKA